MDTFDKNEDEIKYKGFIIEPCNNGYQVVVNARTFNSEIIPYIIASGLNNLNSAKSWVDSCTGT